MPRSIDPNNPWWTPQLKDQRYKVTKSYDKHKNDKKNEALENLYKKEYKKLTRQAKKNLTTNKMLMKNLWLRK